MAIERLYLEEKIRNSEVVSFDIFDTLLLRPYAKPTDLFLHLEILEREPDFQDSRIDAENRARKKYLEQEDITYEQIYESIADKYKYLKDKEMLMEASILKANPEMKEIYNYAVSLGKKIIFISDMYFSNEFLSDILSNNGYKNYSKLYVSSEYKKTKHTGNLYKIVLDDIKIEPKNMLHIGDNYHSDYSVASNMGISTYYYEKIVDRFLKNNDKFKIWYEQNQNLIGVSCTIAILSMSCFKEKDDYWYNFGINFGGPVLYSYAKWLDNQFKKDSIDDVLFVARDGYAIKKIFEMIKTSNVRSHYIYAPRAFNVIMNLSKELFLTVTNYEGQKHVYVKTILSYFKNKDNFLKNNTPNIDVDGIDKCFNFILDNFSIYQNLSNIELNTYKKYFKSFNLDDNSNIASVDSISINLSSSKFLNNFIRDKYSSYFYFVAERALHKDIHILNILAFRHLFTWSNYDSSLLEIIMTSPEPPILGIYDNKPLYQDISNNEKEKSVINIFPHILNGAEDFTKNIKYFFGDTDIFLKSEDIDSLMFILHNNPNSIDKKEFAGIYNAYDSFHTVYANIFPHWYTDKILTVANIISIENPHMTTHIIYLKFKIFGINLTIKTTKKDLKNISWWIPVRKWRDSFRKKLDNFEV